MVSIRPQGHHNHPTRESGGWHRAGFRRNWRWKFRSLGGRPKIDAELRAIVVLGETHLRRVLKSYARYYNKVRTHRSLDKDAPFSRPVQRTGSIMSHGLLGGLHHHYLRV